jgi:hypothetical protein
MFRDITANFGPRPYPVLVRFALERCERDCHIMNTDSYFYGTYETTAIVLSKTIT